MGNNVQGFEAGDEVYGSCDGSFAEYVGAQPDTLARKPANLSFEQAAAAPISGVTALQAVRKAGVGPGQHVLVIGASGGVGTFAVQIAKAFGADVTGVCSTAKVELVRSLGADHVVDYTREQITDGGRRYDVILDIAATERCPSVAALDRPRHPGDRRQGDRWTWLGGFDRSLRAVLPPPFVSQLLRTLARRRTPPTLRHRELIETGAVTPAVDRTYGLSEAAAAIRDVQGGLVRGKAVITI